MGMLTAKQRKAQKLLNRAVDWAGSVPFLAGEMRVSTQTVQEWVKLGRVPATPARLLALLMAEELEDVEAAGCERTLRA